MEKTKITVRISGKEYTMVSSESEEYIHRVAIYVDRKMQEIGYATKLSTNMLAVLTCLNVGDELLKAQDENTRLRKELGQMRQELARMQKENAMLKVRSGSGPKNA